MRVLCINDANKPLKIPESEWIKKDTVYTVVSAAPMGLQQGKLGYKLKEVQLSPESFPYEYYDAQRFAIIIEESVVEEETVSEEADMTI